MNPTETRTEVKRINVNKKYTENNNLSEKRREKTIHASLY